MKRHLLYIGTLLLGLPLAMASCSQDIDESNLYTATGQTVEQFISSDSTLTSFNYILKRVGLDRMMDSYGQYTCYAPSNEGVAAYIDSLYNDPEATIPHNGMTDNSLEGLSDSLCTDIAKYHLTNGLYSIIKMGGSGTTVSTMLGRSISTKVDSLGRTVLNDKAVITNEDIEVTNGLVQKVSQVVPKTSRVLPDVFDRLEDYKIFAEALHRTGLDDSIVATRKNHKNSAGDYGYDQLTGDNTNDTNGNSLYCPTECKVAFTVFAESDAVLRQNGINSFEDLVQYANKVYGGAAGWYDYLNETNHTVSTGNDYTNRFNALNMFVAYHILYAGMAQDQMVFENKTGVPVSTSKWNYVNGGEPFDYYETMLPNTLLKIWEPDGGKTLYINRWKLNNTLTDQVGTTGSAAMHPIRQQGVRIVRQDISALNGYIHPILGMLVYDENVPKGVLHERLRFDSSDFLPEFENNGFRYMLSNEVSALNGGGSGARLAFPHDYFDNIKVFDESTQLRYNVKGDFRSYQADAFQGWGVNYDLAIKLPHVPSGIYEFRLFYSPMDHGGMMQCYYGNKPDVQSMTALSVPLDVRIPAADQRIGWTAFYDEDDQGVASDEALRNRGYMRAPYSFRGHPGTATPSNDESRDANCRGDGTVTLRRILGRINVKQSEDFWFRFKNVINDDPELKWQLDFVEFVPVSIVDNDQYSEDWY